MIKLLFTIIGAFLISTLAQAQANTLELGSSQSMCISGKGPGQDGAINPNWNGASIAIVKNLGDERFNLRIEKDGNIIRNIAVTGQSTKEIELAEGEVMYFDTTMPTKVKVKFKEVEEK